MAKHRKRSRVGSTVAKRGGTGLAAAALSATGLTTVVVTGTTAAVAPNVQLMALVSAANSTSQFFAGSTYYGTDWTEVYGAQQVVPFFTGPAGIAQAIRDNNDGPNQTGVTASGWGAGQTGTALRELSQEDLDSIGLVILDNNSNRAGGGFWTTYSDFAPLLGTDARPSPSNLDVPVLDVAYEYNINSDAPVDPLNPFALGNSLMAYAYGYGQESSALNITQPVKGGPLVYTDPAGNKTTLNQGSHYVVDENGTIREVATNLKDDNGNPVTTTYVTVDSGDLPLTRPLRLLPGGDIVADAIDPTMTALVDAGYADGKGLESDPAIPENPAQVRHMQPGSSLGNLGGVTGTTQEGVDKGAVTAKEDIADPTLLVKKPLAEAAKLPGVSTVTNTLTANGANKVAPTTKTAGTSSSTGTPRSLKNVADDFNSSLRKFAASHDKKKPESKPATDDK